MVNEQEYQQNLISARNENYQNSETKDPKKNSNKSTENIAKKARNAFGVFSLVSFIKVIDIFFIIAIMVALLKDLLDLTVILSLPVIGTAITLMSSIVIGAAMLVCGKRVKVTKKWGIFAFGNIFELLFGLNFIPLETVTAVVVYIFILQERKEAYK